MLVEPYIQIFSLAKDLKVQFWTISNRGRKAWVNLVMLPILVVSLVQRFFVQGGPTFTTRMFSAIQNSLLRHLARVAMMDNFDLAIPAAGLPQLVPTILREEWRCALMEHSEQSVMWAGTNWMLKLLAVNLATTQQVSVGRPTS